MIELMRLPRLALGLAGRGTPPDEGGTAAPVRARKVGGWRARAALTPQPPVRLASVRTPKPAGFIAGGQPLGVVIGITGFQLPLDVAVSARGPVCRGVGRGWRRK